VGQKWDSGTKKWDSGPFWAKKWPVVGNETPILVGNEARFLVGNEPFWPTKTGQSGTEVGHLGPSRQGKK